MVTETRVPWVVLVYRVPREPSAPRIAIWRRMRALGVAQLGDGIVALPEDARTREHLEWLADQVLEAGGTALLMRAQTLTRTDEQHLAQSMATARAEEYESVRTAAIAARTGEAAERRRVLKRLRREMRAAQRRDYFPPAERDAAHAALAALADTTTDDEPVTATAGVTTRTRGGEGS